MTGGGAYLQVTQNRFVSRSRATPEQVRAAKAYRQSTGSRAGHPAAPPPKAAATQPKPDNGIRALSQLVRDLNAVELLQVIRGEDADYLEAAHLIRNVIDTYGATYAREELQRIALTFAGTSDRLQLAGNLTRAATVITDSPNGRRRRSR